MIRLLRIDDSFLYGRSGMLWADKVRAKVIVLIDDGLKPDLFAQRMLKLACPDVVTLVFSDVEGAGDQLARYLRSREPAIAVIGSFSQALLLYPYFEGISRVNVGSVRGNPSRELVALERLREKGMEFEIRNLPDDDPVILPSQTEPS